MKRVAVAPRKNWVEKVEEVGLIYHHTAEGVYWDESACWEFSMEEVLKIERATEALHALALEAAQHVIDTQRYVEFGIPALAIPLIEATWNLEPPALYGRMDLAYDGKSEPKLLEYNADTPTGLVEAAIAQWYWLQEVSPKADQFNSLHERLVEKWKDLRSYGIGPVHFAHVNQEEGEDLMTVAYLRETAKQAGIESIGLAIEEIGWNTDRGVGQFVDLSDQPIQTLFKLYPWEWLVHEDFGAHLSETNVNFIEPIWKMLLSNKAILAVMWELNPKHPNLLPAHLDGPRTLTHYAKKPRMSREGANITLVSDHGETTPGDYGEEGYVWQALADLTPEKAIIGSWMIDQSAAGMGVREPPAGRQVTTNMGRFLPHRIV
jgi:glutathionylspermidine synthase